MEKPNCQKEQWNSRLAHASRRSDSIKGDPHPVASMDVGWTLISPYKRRRSSINRGWLEEGAQSVRRCDSWVPQIFSPLWSLLGFWKALGFWGLRTRTEVQNAGWQPFCVGHDVLVTRTASQIWDVLCLFSIRKMLKSRLFLRKRIFMCASLRWQSFIVEYEGQQTPFPSYSLRKLEDSPRQAWAILVFAMHPFYTRDSRIHEIQTYPKVFKFCEADSTHRCCS